MLNILPGPITEGDLQLPRPLNRVGVEHIVSKPDLKAIQTAEYRFYLNLRAHLRVREPSNDHLPPEIEKKVLSRIILDEDGAKALTPRPPLTRKKTRERGEKKDLHHFLAHLHKRRL